MTLASEPKVAPYLSAQGLEGGEFVALRNPVSTERLIEAAQAGRITILTNRGAEEDEGVLILPAQLVTPDAVNFMATHAGGIICVGLTEERIRHLAIPPMPRRDGDADALPHAASIESRHGVTTGISASDRAITIQVAINPDSTSEDLVSPGHVFPCVTRKGGVLVRAGFAEAAVDLAVAAGLNPSAVVCKILNDEGETARGEDLRQFAQAHGLEMGTISDLIAYRRRTEKLVERCSIAPFESEFGGVWQLHTYHDVVAGRDILALVKGEVDPDHMLVRVHTLSIMEDVLGLASGRSGLVPSAMAAIAEVGAGVLVLLSQPDADHHGAEGGVLREYGLGAQVLNDLGVRRIELLKKSNLERVVGLEGFGLEVLGLRDF